MFPIISDILFTGEMVTNALRLVSICFWLLECKKVSMYNDFGPIIFNLLAGYIYF